jgi:predicted transcriptional regulator
LSPVKETAIKIIQALPENCTWDDIQYRLYFRGEVEQGLQDLEEGKVVPNAEAQRRMLEWARSIGLKKP